MLNEIRKDKGSNVQMKKFSIKDKLGYMFGDVGNDFAFGIVGSYLMVYYTDIFGLKAAAVGLLFMIARFWDAFVDVLVGRFIDSRPATKKGKYKTWMLRFSPALALLTVLLFTKIPGQSTGFYVVYAYVTYIIWGSLFSAVNIPFGSMASVITNDAAERSSLSTFRSIGATAAQLIVRTGVPLVAFVNNKISSERFFIVAIAVSIFTVLCFVICYVMSIERVTLEQLDKAPTSKEKKLKLSFMETMKGVAHNKPFIVLVLSSIALMISMMFISSMNAYLYKDYFKSTTALSLVGLSGLILIVVLGPTVGPITKKFGRKESVSVAMLFTAVIYFIAGFSKITNPYIFIVLILFGIIGYNFFNFVIWAFVTDVIDYQELITGKREDGTIYSLYSFARKIGQAFAGGLSGFALGAIGYVPKAVQTPEVALKIKQVSTFGPAVGFFVVFLLITFLYPLNKEKLAKLTADIKAQRAA